MKHIKRMIAFIVIIFTIGLPFSVSALDNGLTTEPLPDEEISRLINLDANEFIKITSYTPQAVKRFDVREDHMILIGVNKGETAVVVVYDNLGNFQYGFEKQKSGNFEVMWSNNNIAYYSIRSDLLFIVNKDGKIIDIKKVASNMETSIYKQNVLESTTRTVDTTTYRMTNGTIADFFSSSYKKITKTDTEGTTVIYDASRNWRSRIIWGIIAFLLISSFIAFGIVDGIKKHCTKIKNQENKESVLLSPDETENSQE